MSVQRREKVQSVINRLQAVTNQQNNAQQNNPLQSQPNVQNNNTNNTPPPSRFQPGNTNTNQNGGLFNRVNNGNQPLSWMCTPINTTVVHFDLRGLGDPFYRLLGKPINADYGDPLKFSEMLEQGGEAALTLESMLEENWIQYELMGAVLVYPWNANIWKSIARPVPMPVLADLELDDSPNQAQNQTEQEPRIKCLRALDLSLVLNVLARARTQILLSSSPLILNRQLLMRSLVSDDPRLIDLARATGFIEEPL